MERFGRYFDVVAYGDNHGLVIRNNESVAAVVNEIDEIVRRAQSLGYHNNEKWIIVSVDWSRTFREDGGKFVFVSSSEQRKAVALYDNGKVTFCGEEA